MTLDRSVASVSFLSRYGGNIYNGTFKIKLGPDKLSKIQFWICFYFLLQVRSKGIHPTFIQHINVSTVINSLLFSRYIYKFSCISSHHKTKNKKPTLFCFHLFLISSLYLLSIFLSFLERLFYFFNTGYKTCANEFIVKCGH